MRLDLQRRSLTLATPLQTSFGTIRSREIITVRLTDDDGLHGHGEAAPLPLYDGVSVERTMRALHAHREAIDTLQRDRARARAAGGSHRPSADARSRQPPTGATHRPPGEAHGPAAEASGSHAAAHSSSSRQPQNRAVRLLDACRQADPLPQALAAIDMALWDRAGRREGRPVCELLSDRPRGTVPVNATIASIDRAGAAAEAAEAARSGFACVKVKVGLGDDAGRVAAVRAAIGPHLSLRLDANGAWTVPEAVAAIEALSPAGLELVEEPTHGLAGVRAVREQVAARIAIDETAAEPGALGAGVADAVCLKISRCGGISGLLAAAALVRASGAEPYLASTLDGPLGIAAAVHAAAALASRGPLPPCGLATLGMFASEDDALPVQGGQIAVPAQPGLGVPVLPASGREPA